MEWTWCAYGWMLVEMTVCVCVLWPRAAGVLDALVSGCLLTGPQAKGR